MLFTCRGGDVWCGKVLRVSVRFCWAIGEVRTARCTRADGLRVRTGTGSSLLFIVWIVFISPPSRSWLGLAVGITGGEFDKTRYEYADKGWMGVQWGPICRHGS